MQKLKRKTWTKLFKKEWQGNRVVKDHSGQFLVI